MALEKASMEEHVMGLDIEVERLSQQVESLEMEKEKLEGKMKQQGKQLVVEDSRRKVLEEDVAWLL